MKNFGKKLGKWIIAIVVVTLIGLFIWQLYYKPIKDTNNVAKIVTLDQTPSDTTRDNKGQLHGTKEFIPVPNTELAEALYRPLIDSLRKENAFLKNAQIKSAGTISTSTETAFKPTVIYDTVTRYITFTHKTKWMDLNVTSDTSKMSKLAYRDSLTFATVSKPYGFLKLKERQFIDVKSANPDVKHIGVTYFQVEPARNNKAKVGFGAGIGPGAALIGTPEGPQIKPSWLTVQAGLQIRF